MLGALIMAVQLLVATESLTLQVEYDEVEGVPLEQILVPNTVLTLRDILPPAQYDKPIPMDQIKILRRQPQDIAKSCGKTGIVYACAYVHDNTCYMILPPGVVPGSPIWRHEQAHCNGWPDDHRRW